VKWNLETARDPVRGRVAKLATSAHKCSGEETVKKTLKNLHAHGQPVEEGAAGREVLTPTFQKQQHLVTDNGASIELAICNNACMFLCSLKLSEMDTGKVELYARVRKFSGRRKTGPHRSRRFLENSEKIGKI
jgi:hypothetical protein